MYSISIISQECFGWTKLYQLPLMETRHFMGASPGARCGALQFWGQVHAKFGPLRMNGDKKRRSFKACGNAPNLKVALIGFNPLINLQLHSSFQCLFIIHTWNYPYTHAANPFIDISVHSSLHPYIHPPIRTFIHYSSVQTCLSKKLIQHCVFFKG